MTTETTTYRYEVGDHVITPGFDLYGCEILNRHEAGWLTAETAEYYGLLYPAVEPLYLVNEGNVYGDMYEAMWPESALTTDSCKGCGGQYNHRDDCVIAPPIPDWLAALAGLTHPF